jgi:hypothetical protein
MATRRKRRPPPPKALSFLICDYIHRDASTGKATLIGCFANLYAPAFPIVVPVMAVYAVITNGHGKVPIHVRIVDADESLEPINESTFEVEFADPRMTAEVIGFLTNVTFPKAGEYRLQLFAWEDCLVERKIAVAESKK